MKKRLLRFLLPPLLLGAAVWWGLPWLFPLPEALLAPREASVVYTARDGTPLRQLLTLDGDRALPTTAFADLPPLLVAATLAAEDKRFWTHGGLDLLAIARAARDNADSGRVVSGASTLHQQLIKTARRRGGRATLGVKVVEALQARRLAMSWSRERVLEEYLGRISYGNLLTGCTAAAAGYFNKPLKDLTAAECALLAAIPQAPARFNPFRDLAAIQPRQRLILEKMHALGWLPAADLQTALAQPLTLQRFTGGFAAPHAVELLRATGAPPTAAPVRTTLDATLQRQVETIIAARLATLKDRHVTQAAAVVLENATGHVLALAGSRDFFSRDGGQINGAWAPHSPGSAIKPFTYAIAFERGATPATLAADLPVEYPTPTGIYRPENYAHRIYGPVTYRDALGNSLNIAAVKVLSSAGGAPVLLERLRALGLTTLTEDAEHYGLGLTIGNAPVRLLELAGAYACLARMGEEVPWTLLPRETPPAPTRRLGALECFWIADILADNQARHLTFGTHSPLRLPFPVAVKTGTSQSYRDNWTVGYTPEYTVAVWAGNFDNTPMQEVSGVTGAAPIWRDVFLHLRESRRLTWYSPPAGLVKARVDPRTGKRLTPRSPPARVSREEWFRTNQLPPQAVPEDYDARGRALLPPEYARWARSADNWMGDLVVAGADERREWRISNPTPGTVIRLDPDIPGQGRRLLLETEPAQEVEWTCPTLEVRHDGDVWQTLLRAGRHEFTARHRQTGELKRSFVIVHAE